jgi:FSR family fosmidomycin resistance protein-like MFS transporter
MIIFVPLIWINLLGMTEVAGNARLTMYSIAGAAATLAGGRIADKYGFRRFATICTVLAPPFYFAFAFSQASWLSTIMCLIIAILLSGCQSTFVVLGQSFLPNRIGFASGVMYGLTVSVGGMVAPGIGWIGDNFGLEKSILTLACISVVGLIFSLTIPKSPADATPAKTSLP